MKSRRVPALISMAADDHHRYILGELPPELLTHDATALAAFFEGHLVLLDKLDQKSHAEYQY